MLKSYTFNCASNRQGRQVNSMHVEGACRAICAMLGFNARMNTTCMHPCSAHTYAGTAALSRLPALAALQRGINQFINKS